MAEDGDNNNDIFVYMGGRVPQHLRETITHVRIHKSVKIITRSAFQGCRNLVSIEMHDGVEIIEGWAFSQCHSLRGIKLPGVENIGNDVFYDCTALTDVEFGDKLETIGSAAFQCTSLRSIKLQKIRFIENHAFSYCGQLMNVELSEDLERIGSWTFLNCTRLESIALPLKANLLRNTYVFTNCGNISQVDLVGGIHNTISSLLLDSWRNEMNEEIDRINGDLPNTPTDDKTEAVQHWMEIVIERIEHCKAEHHTLLKEFTTLLELALWKAKLDGEFGGALSKEDGDNESNATKKAKIDTKASRQERRITSGAGIVMKNVLPFLELE